MKTAEWTRNSRYEEGWLTNSGDVVLKIEYTKGEQEIVNYLRLCMTYEINDRKEKKEVFFIRRAYDNYPLFVSDKLAKKIINNPEIIIDFAIDTSSCLNIPNEYDEICKQAKEKRKGEIIEIVKLEDQNQRVHGQIFMFKIKQVSEIEDLEDWKYMLFCETFINPIVVAKELADEIKENPQLGFDIVCCIAKERWK